MRTWTLNVGGQSGFWRLVEELERHKPEVVFLQETSAGSAEEQAMRRTAGAKGYNLTLSPSYTVRQRWGGVQHKGGTGLLVRKDLRQRSTKSQTRGKASITTAVVEGWQLTSMYAPPGGPDRAFLEELLHEESIQEAWQGRSWMVAGDANIEAKLWDTNSMAAVFRDSGGQLHAVGKPTRWDGTREIDWMVSTLPSKVVPERIEHWFSDHMALQMDIPTNTTPEKQGRLRTTPSWKKPKEIPKALWTETLDQVLAEEGDKEGSAAKLLRTILEKGGEEEDAKADVEKEWDLWNAALTATFKGTAQRLALRAKPPWSEKAVKALQDMADAKGDKGGAGKHVASEPVQP